MQDFQDLFNKAVKIKNADMAARRKEFESKPLFIKAGLYYWPKFEAVRQHQFQQRYFSAELMKYNGNAYFKQGEFDKAVKEYEQALSIFRYVKNKNKNWRKEGIKDEDLVYVDDFGYQQAEKKMVLQLKLILYHNLAAGYLRVKQFEAAINSCDEALVIDSKSTKALFRRAKALYMDMNSSTDEYKRAVQDLKRALEIEPKDTEIQDLMIKINQDIQKMKKNVSGNLKNMFQKKEPQQQQNDQQQQQQSQQQQQQQQQQPKQQKQQKIQDIQDPNARLQAVRAKLRQKQLEQEQQKQKEAENNKSKSVQRNNQQDEVEQQQKRNKSQQQQQSMNNSSGNNKKQRKTSDNSNEVAENQKKEEQRQEKMSKMQQDNNNVKNFWKMFNIEKDYDNFDYDLSYHTDPNAKVPKEIKELGKFINTKGKEMVNMFERAGRIQEAQDLKDKLQKAKAAKNQLEKISKLDFNRPTDKLIDIAQKYNIDIYDDAIKNEFRNIQKQNLQDIRSWLAANDQQIEDDDEDQDEDDLFNGTNNINKNQFEDDDYSDDSDIKIKRDPSVKSTPRKQQSDNSKKINSRNSSSQDFALKAQNGTKQVLGLKSRNKNDFFQDKNSKNGIKNINTYSSKTNYKDIWRRGRLDQQQQDSDLEQQIDENVNDKDSYSDDYDNNNNENNKDDIKYKKQANLRSQTTSKNGNGSKNSKRAKSSRKRYQDSDSEEDFGNQNDLEDARNYNKSKKKNTNDQESENEEESDDYSGNKKSKKNLKRKNSDQKNKKKKKKKNKETSESDSNNDDDEKVSSDEEKDKIDENINDREKENNIKEEDEDDKKSSTSKKSNFNRKGKKEHSQALAIPGKKYNTKQEENMNTSEFTKEQEELKKKLEEDPYRPTPYAPLGLNKEGKPIVSVDDPDFNMSYYHPDMEINYCNPENDPNIQISKNNRHNNLTEDFSTKGKYFKMEEDPTQNIELKNLKQSLQTKHLVQQQNDDLIEDKEVEEGEQSMWGQLLIFVSIGFFIITIIYHFFNSRDQLSPEETMEIFEHKGGMGSGMGLGGMGGRGSGMGSMGGSKEEDFTLLDPDLQL